MNSTIDRMLTLTAAIAEQLLEAKDNLSGEISAQTKLDIISLAELAAELPENVKPDDEQPAGKELSHAESETLEEPNVIPEETVALKEPLLPIEQPIEQHQEETVVETASVTTPEPVEDKFTEPEFDISLWRQAFSVNDLFYFRHELFRDSDILFNQALSEIGMASSPVEVRQILSDRYGIDLKRQSSKEFLAIVSAYFD